MKNILKTITLAIGLLVLLPIISYAQSISGQVNDSSGTYTFTAPLTLVTPTPTPTPSPTATPSPTPTATPTPLPDLIVSSISETPTSPVVGSHVVFSAVVTNQGSGPTPPGVIIGVAFDVDGTEVTWSDNDTTSLPAGSSVTLTANNGPANVNFWTATAGTHALLAWVNDVARFPESNTNNNKLNGTITVGSAPTPTPTPTPSPTSTPTPSPTPTATPTATPSPTPTPTPTPTPVAGNSPFVFAHYHMPYCTGNTGGCSSNAATLQANYQNDIQNAIALGINGFVLNAGTWISVENRYPRLVAGMYAAADAYNAAHGTSFKLMISPDLSGGASNWPQSDIVNVLNTYCSDPAQFTIHGKCVLSGWNIDTGTTGAGFRSMFAASNVGASGVFFVPGFNGQGVTNALSSTWKPYIDGVFPFQCCATNSVNSSGGNGTAINDALSYEQAVRAAGNGYNGFPLVYMAGTTSHFWETASSYNWYMETQGFQGLENYWNQIINVTHPDWVEAFTWSDIGESWEAPVTGLANGSPQGGGTALQAYYIKWAQSGNQPPIHTDQLYYSYRVNPAAMSCTGHVRGNVAGGVPVLDDIYITTLLSPGVNATLTVNSGGTTTTKSVGPGIVNIAIPFTVGSTQTFTLTRNGNVEISLAGPAITNAGGACNFDPVTGVGYSNGYAYPPYSVGALTLAP